jgi:sugar lactone lactonase YvrE
MPDPTPTPTQSASPCARPARPLHALALALSILACSDPSAPPPPQPDPPPDPGTPSGITATPGVRAVSVQWSPVEDAVGYNVYFSDASGFALADATLVPSVASPWVHDGLEGRGVRHYVVTAITAGGESPPSPEASAAPLALVGGAVQGRPLSLAGTVTTFAGPPGGADAIDGVGPAAAFYAPWGLAADDATVYVADSLNYTIRAVALATGEVTTLAGSAGQNGATDGVGSGARFTSPTGLVRVGAFLYVADHCQIRSIEIQTATVTTIAGGAPGGACDFSDSADPSAARFRGPLGIASDGAALYVADSGNHRIRKVVLATGEVSTLAGSGAAGLKDEVGPLATFRSPAAVAHHGGFLYVADTSNSAIRKVAVDTGTVITYAGSTSGGAGTTDGVGTTARFTRPTGLATDGTSLFVADTVNHTVRRIDLASARVSTLGGWPTEPGWSDGKGSWARFYEPTGVVAAGGAVYVSDRGSHVLRRLDPASTAVTTVAGTPGGPGSRDGPAGDALFSTPTGITTDGIDLYVAGNCAIRRISRATGEVETIAGGACSYLDGFGRYARFVATTALTTDGTSLFVADAGYGSYVIRKVDLATLEVTTLAGTPGLPGSTDGLPGVGRLGLVLGITTDGARLYVADSTSHTVRAIDVVTGEITTIAGLAGAAGHVDGPPSAARFSEPRGITTDGASLFVTESGNDDLRRIDLATGEVTTIGNPAGTCGYAPLTLCVPSGVTTDGRFVYVADLGHMVRRLDLASPTLEMTWLAGAPALPGYADGAGLEGRFRDPRGLTVDEGALYVADWGNYKIRRIE